jgi:hypothetical protein
VNDETWSASMSDKIDGNGGHLMHRSGICPNGQLYALTEDAAIRRLLLASPMNECLVVAIAHSKAVIGQHLPF